jgi:hypothetical protein
VSFLALDPFSLLSFIRHDNPKSTPQVSFSIVRLRYTQKRRSAPLVCSAFQRTSIPSMTERVKDQLEPPATMAEMQEAVGSLFMLWSKVEADLAKAVAELNGPSAADKLHGIGRTIAAWKALHDDIAGDRPEHLEVVSVLHEQLVEALRVRNSIAHGLDGYGVGASDGSSEAYFRVQPERQP